MDAGKIQRRGIAVRHEIMESQSDGNHKVITTDEGRNG
jgi:hypothetical protein